MEMDDCISQTYESLDDTAPWWFHTMLRDAHKFVTRRYHDLQAPTPNGNGLHFCSIEKIGTKHWRKLMCKVQEKSSTRQGSLCRPETPISEEAPRAVFLRDPLERFLSAYIDKCVSFRRIEGHCEPIPVFPEEGENELTKGFDKSKKSMFETYVNTMPLKWNMHFFPQRYESQAYSCFLSGSSLSLVHAHSSLSF